MGFLESLGRQTLSIFHQLGAVILLLMAAVREISAIRGRETCRQCLSLGVLSFPIVALTLLFTGMVLSVQIAGELTKYGADFTVGAIVAIGIGRELGPVLCGVVLAGRVGAAITAEIGTMRVTEQIDALVTLSADPIRHLVTPRIWAAILAVPMLVGVGDVIGIMGGWIIGVQALGFNSTTYLANSWAYLEGWDVVSGLLKGAAFGLIVALSGCWFGMRAGGGAAGVGRATTNAVVAASVGILAANFVLTGLFF